MSMDPVLVRRILGTASVVLVIAVSTVLLDWRYAPAPGSYEVVAELGRAGSGVNRGTDVKVRGVTIGQVEAIHYEDATAYATLVLDPEPRLPAPDRLELFVTPKTFLGEKQVELRFADEDHEREPFLGHGDLIRASSQPTEVSEAIAALEPFVRAIDPHDVATIFETFAQQQGEGEAVAENIELGQQLAAFGARTADDALDRMRDFGLVMDSLTDAVPDLTRTAEALPEATAVLVERQADLRRNLLTVSRFSRTLTTWLEGTEPALVRFLRTSQPVGDVLEPQVHQLGSLIDGLVLYTSALGAGGLLLDDGSEMAGFRLFIHDFDPVKLLCHEAEEVFGDEPPALCRGVDG